MVQFLEEAWIFAWMMVLIPKTRVMFYNQYCWASSSSLDQKNFSSCFTNICPLKIELDVTVLTGRIQYYNYVKEIYIFLKLITVITVVFVYNIYILVYF